MGKPLRGGHLKIARFRASERRRSVDAGGGSRGWPVHATEDILDDGRVCGSSRRGEGGPRLDVRYTLRQVASGGWLE